MQGRALGAASDLRFGPFPTDALGVGGGVGRDQEEVVVDVIARRGGSPGGRTGVHVAHSTVPGSSWFRRPTSTFRLSG
jgi:hypothetical protein